MEETLIQRIQRLICKIFGHRCNIGASWDFKGTHCVCKVCSEIVTFEPKTKKWGK